MKQKKMANACLRYNSALLDAFLKFDISIKMHVFLTYEEVIFYNGF